MTRRFLLFMGLCLVAGGPGWTEIWHGCDLAPSARDAWVVTIETTQIFRTPDFGQSWQEQPVLTNYDFFDVFFLDESNGWTCGRIAEVWHTTNGGSVWNWQAYGNSKFFTRIEFVDETHGWAAAGAAIMGRWDEANLTWQQILLPNPPFHADTCDFYGISFIDTLTGWMCAGRYPEGDTFLRGQGYIGHTTDGGFTWGLQRRDTVNDLFDLEFLDAQTGWVVGGNDQTMRGWIARTSDGGATWVPQNPGNAGLLRAVDFVDQSRGWAVGKFGTIIYTSDGGATWSPQTSGVDSTLFDVDFADAQHGMACGVDAVLFTSDGGATWVRSLVGATMESKSDTRGPRPEVSLRVGPNPARSAVTMFCQLPAATAALTVFDIEGRLVRRLAPGTRESGPGTRRTVVWDGSDDRGNRVNPGVYVVRLTTGDIVLSETILYLRD